MESKKRWFGLWDRQFYFDKDILVDDEMNLCKGNLFPILLNFPSFKVLWYLVEANAKGRIGEEIHLATQHCELISCHLIFCRGWFTICIIKAEWMLQRVSYVRRKSLFLWKWNTVVLFCWLLCGNYIKTNANKWKREGKSTKDIIFACTTTGSRCWESSSLPFVRFNNF